MTRWENAKSLGLLVSSGSRLLRRGSTKGLDKAFVKAVEKKGKNIAEIRAGLEKVLAQFLEAKQRMGRPAMTVARFRREIEVLLRRAETTLPVARSRKAREFGRPDGVLGTALGHNLVALAERRRAIDEAEEALFGTARRDGAGGRTPPASAAEQKRAALFAAQREAVDAASALVERFFAVWNEVLNPAAIRTIIDKVAVEMEKQRQQLTRLLAELRELERAAQKSNSVGLREAIAVKVNQINRAKEPVTAALRSRFGYYRGKVLKKVLESSLQSQLAAISIVLSKRKTGSVKFVLAVGDANQAGKVRFEIPLDVDHTSIDFADAVNRWVKTGDPKDLDPILAGDNMRLVTELENQVLFTRLKQDAAQWPHPADRKALKPGMRADVSKALATLDDEPSRELVRIRAALGREFTQNESDLIEWALRNIRF